MAISVTQFRARCLELIRRIESKHEPVDITRRGKVVARLGPPPSPRKTAGKPWERLLGSGELAAPPEESVLTDEDLEAAR